MSIIKRADLTGKMVISETLLECPKCGHQDIGQIRPCPVCKTEMIVKCNNSTKED